MDVKNFENKRWRENDQKVVFRHTKALEMAEGPRVLDVGCGDGLFLGMLNKKGFEAYGVDMSEDGVRKCREKGLDAVVYDASRGKLPFDNNVFDSVSLLDILEHLYDPQDLLQEVVRVSKKYVIVSVPNFNSLPARLQALLGTVPENNRPNKGHVYWFNYNNLANMLKKNNLEISLLVGNTFFEHKPFVGPMMKVLAKHFPSIFALSFVVKAKKSYPEFSTSLL